VTTGFAAATAATPDGPNRYAVTVDEGWAIGGNPHGGYLMALVARAAVAASPHPDPLTVSTNFLRPPKFGTGTVEVEEVRVGRSVATHRARLVEDDASVLEMTVTTGTLPDAEPAWTVPVPEFPPVDECVQARRQAPNGVDVRIMDHVDVRFDPSCLGWARGEPGPQPPEMRGWFRIRDADTDPFGVVIAADVLPPTVFALGIFGWAPTVEMTTLLRARPAPGWLRISVSTGLVRDRWFDEDVTVWDEDGAVVAQGRQLALLGRT
jgi:hypothetical protein